MAVRVTTRTVATAIGLYVLGAFVQKGAFFATLPLYARMLDVDGYARWSLFVGLFAALSIAFDLSWSRAVPRLYYEYVPSPAAANRYLVLSFQQRLCLLVVSTLVFLAVAPPLLRFASAGKLASSVFSAALVAICAAEAIVLYVCATYRARQVPLSFVSLKIGQTILQLGCSLAAIVTCGATPEYAANGFALGSVIAAAGAISIFVWWARSVAPMPPLPCLGTLRANLRFGLPLVLHDYASWLRNAADPFIIVQFLPLYAVSVYHIGYQFGLLVGLVLYSAELALSPVYVELFKSDTRFAEKYLAVTRVVVVSTFALAISLALFAREVIALIFPAEMREAARIAPLIVIGYFFFGLYSVYIKPFVLLARTGIIPLITLVPTLLGVAGSIILIPMLGVTGPALSTVASFALLAGLTIAAAHRVMPLRYPFRLHVALSVTVLVVGAGASGAWQMESLGIVIIKAGVWLCLIMMSCVLLTGGRTLPLRVMTTPKSGEHG